jgi:hypothetical protein
MLISSLSGRRQNFLPDVGVDVRIYTVLKTTIPSDLFCKYQHYCFKLYSGLFSHSISLVYIDDDYTRQASRKISSTRNEYLYRVMRSLSNGMDPIDHHEGFRRRLGEFPRLWVLMQRWLIFVYRRFGTAYLFDFQ